MKQTHILLLLGILLVGPVVLISCGELSTPGDPISINSSSPREAYLGEYYTNLIRVTGGLNSYSYKIEKGNLPPGLSLSDLGQIQGTPTTIGDYSFTVVVRDANLSKTFADMVLSVRKAPPAQLRLNIPMTEMNEEFPVQPEILDARALQGFRTKLNWDASKMKLVEDSLRVTSDRIIMFEKIEEGSLQVDIAVKGEALSGNHRLFVFALEPLQNDFVSVQGDVEFVKSDGKRGFQQLNEGRVSVDENQQDQADESSDDQGNQTQDSGETSSTEENGTGSENDQ